MMEIKGLKSPCIFGFYITRADSQCAATTGDVSQIVAISNGNGWGQSLCTWNMQGGKLVLIFGRLV